MPSWKSSKTKTVSILKNWLFLWLPMLMLAALPLMSDFMHSRRDVSARYFLLLAPVSLLTATLLAAGFHRLFRRDRTAGLFAATVAALFFSNGYDTRLSIVYPAFRALTPITINGPWQGALYSFIFIALILLTSYWLGRLLSFLARRRPRLHRELPAAVLLAISITFIIQAVPFIRTVAAEWGQFSYRPPHLNWTPSAPSSKPDIYYLVYDDFAGSEALKSQLGFDDTSFKDFLTNQGFYVNPTLLANYPSSATSIASTLSADYNRDIIDHFRSSREQTIVPYHRTVQNAPVAAELKSLGYSYTELGNWYDTSTHSPLADHFDEPYHRLTILGISTTLDLFASDELSQSPYWQFILPGLSVGHFKVFNYSSLDGADLALHGMRSLDQLADQAPGGRFIFAHILQPHSPYYFNADGSLNQNLGADNAGEPLSQKYINDVKYLQGRIKSTLTKINQRSQGKAIVIFQSDEGPNLAVNADEDADTKALSHDAMQLKYSMANAYRIPGATEEDMAAAADPVNVFRLVFNVNFGTKLPYLPRCYYQYNSDQPMTYSDVSKQLTGQANSSCAADGSGPR